MVKSVLFMPNITIYIYTIYTPNLTPSCSLNTDKEPTPQKTLKQSNKATKEGSTIRKRCHVCRISIVKLQYGQSG